MPAKNKVGTQLLLPEHVRDRARALAIVRNDSMASVYRAALEGGGLNALERRHDGEISRLHAALNTLGNTTGLDKSAALEEMLQRRMKVADLYEGGQIVTAFP